MFFESLDKLKYPMEICQLTKILHFGGTLQMALEKTTHDLLFPFTFWTTVPSLPPVSLVNGEEEDFDEDLVKQSQKPTDMKSLKEFLTFEDFWTIYNTLERPSTVYGRGGYYILKSGFKPPCTDSIQFPGDIFYIKYSATCRNDTESRDVEIKFLHVLLTVLGHNFPLCDRIYGITFESRKTEAIIAIQAYKIEEPERDILKKQIIPIFGKNVSVSTIFNP